MGSSLYLPFCLNALQREKIMENEIEANALSDITDIKHQIALTNQKVDQLTNALVELANVLKQQHSSQAELVNKAVQDAINPLSLTLYQLKSLAAYTTRHQYKEKGSLIRVVFLVNLIEAWDALHDIYLLMKENPRFDPVVISINHAPVGSHFAHEEKIYAHLVSLGIEPVRFNNPNAYIDLEMLKLLDPDIIFRQTPWDTSIPPAFRFNEINFAKICYVPYGILMIPFKEEDINYSFYKSCWRMYYDHPSQLSMLSSHVKKDVLRLSGQTKIARILDMQNEPAWPLPVLPNTIRVIWAPHHSLEQQTWVNLNYSTFLYNYQQFLQLARECPEIQIVLKPHQILFSKLVELKLLTQQEMDQFIAEFSSLPNAAIVTGGDYFPLMWASDLMITDGISFFGEYMITEKPIIWTKNPRRYPMNELGELLVSEGTYQADTFDQVIAYIEQLFVQHDDPLAENRKSLKAQLQPNNGGSAQFIVNDILQGIDYPDC